MNPYDKVLRVQGYFLAGFLVLQYLLGMYVNLFVTFPDNATEGQLWQFAWSQPALAAHIVVAIAIFIGAIVLCVRAARNRPSVWVGPSFIGLLAVFAAGFMGSRFIPTQTDAFSYLMSLAFIVAFCAYAWGIIASRNS